MEPLLRKYGYKAYFCGHGHALGYSEKEGIAYFLSGAGGNSCGAHGGMKEPMGNHVYGFLKAKVVDSKLYGTYYYTTDKINWNVWHAPVFALVE